MFWKKNSKDEEYKNLCSKLSSYTNRYSESFGSKEYLPTKSDLDNLSEEELTKFKAGEYLYKLRKLEDKLKTEKETYARAQASHLAIERPDLIEGIKEGIEKRTTEVNYYNEFLEALEAGGLREKAPEEKEDLISLINKKDGSAVTYFLNQTIENQDGVILYELYCNTLFNLFEFFTIKRTPISDWFESGNFLEGLTLEYTLEHDIAGTEVPDEVNDYISNGQMESELNEEHFVILKDGIHKLCVTTQNEFDTLKNYLGFVELESHSYLTYILYSKNNPKMAAIQLKIDDAELDTLYKEFTELLSEDELNTLYENAEKYRTEYIEELVEKVNKERTKRLDYENYSVDPLDFLMLASNYALDASIAGRLKGKALIQEIIDQKIADDALEEVAKKYLEWF